MSAFRDDAWPSKQRTGQPSELHVYTGSTSPRLPRVLVCSAHELGLNAVTPPSKHKATQGIQSMLFQCWPVSPSLAQH